MEVHGEDPDCVLHGVATDWAIKNMQPFEWRDLVLNLREEIASAYEAGRLTGREEAEEAAHYESYRG